MDFYNELEKYKNIVENELKKVLNELDLPQQEIVESMRYSLLSGGKRLRPILLIKSCELFGGNIKSAIKLSIAMEMIHTYSLIHDDLPAMDDDDYRRGQLTNHKVYDESIAILAGDSLLNYAYELMIDEVIANDYSKKYVDAMNIIAKSSGYKGMIGGQVVDIISEKKQIDDKTLNFIHKYKTSKLIEASIIAGSIIGGANTQEINTLKKYSEYIGISFQIKDDILDIVGDKNILGKDIGSDIDKKKSTYVSIYGMERAKSDLNMYKEKAVNIMRKFESDESFFFIDLAEYLTKRVN
ncbi:polyprenyl synthetase family protein [Senegalia massiliensis]|uniref:Farnesyl diphosphate synthase n=1 Tax=Senegalia massiliensis TaxID=1720316 RepID=A0A845QZN5_9CLOT|nr:farnesyl diphosphate synthase [Senegalia massiliensis]NBI06642.1 polyprenyl synthetase family protein [Senegalia massiliensis]